MNINQFDFLEKLKTLPVRYFDWDFVNQIKNLADERQRDYFNSDEYKALRAKQDEEYVIRKDRQNRRDKKIAGWVKQNIKIGDVVRFKGTRDKHGYRQIVDLHFGVALSGKQFVRCSENEAEIYFPIKRTKYQNKLVTRYLPYKLTHAVTTQNHNKLCAVYKCDTKSNLAIEQKIDW